MSVRTAAVVLLGVPDLPLRTGHAGPPVPPCSGGTLAAHAVTIPYLSAVAGDANKPIPVCIVRASTALGHRIPDLSLLATDASAAIPVLTKRAGTVVETGIPDLGSCASINAVVAVPGESRLTSNAGKAVVVSVGWTGGDALTEVAN